MAEESNSSFRDRRPGVFDERRRLERFLAVVESESISEAAARLNLSQPGLGRSVAVLQDRLGRVLLVRRRRGVEVTPFGLAVAREARGVIARMDEAEKRLRRLAEAIPRVSGED